jgi:hypothetical protein
MDLGAFIQKFQNLPAFMVRSVTPEGTVTDWYQVHPATLIPELVIQEADIPAQLAQIPGQVMFWGRMVSHAQRVWEMEQRHFRTWKAKQYLSALEAPQDPEAAKGWKKPTEKQIEATYRLHPEYAGLNQRIEEAAEAFNAANSILDAFKAKREMLRLAIGPAQAKMTT